MELEEINDSESNPLIQTKSQSSTALPTTKPHRTTQLPPPQSHPAISSPTTQLQSLISSPPVEPQPSTPSPPIEPPPSTQSPPPGSQASTPSPPPGSQPSTSSPPIEPQPSTSPPPTEPQRSTPSPLPGSQPPSSPAPEPYLLDNDEFRSWQIMFKRSRDKKVSVPWVTFLCLVWLLENAVFFATLFIAFVSSTVDATFDIISFFLYVVAHSVTAAINYYNEKQEEECDSSTHKWDVRKTILTYVGVFRYLKDYEIRKEQFDIIKRQLETREVAEITTTLQSLKGMMTELLKFKRLDLTIAYCCKVPIVFIQLYILFRNNEYLCHFRNFTRLATIILNIGLTAWSSADFEGAKSDYEAVVHFLSVLKSLKRIPLKTAKNSIVWWIGVFNFLRHLGTTSLRLYITAVFLVRSWILALVYLAALFVLNLISVLIFPSTLLEIHTNAPLGISTRISYWVDRYINTFSTTCIGIPNSRNVTIFSKRVKPPPLLLLLIFHVIYLFAMPIFIVLIVSVVIPVDGESRTTGAKPEQCSQSADWHWYSVITQIFAKVLFFNVNDLFSSVSVIALLLVIQLICLQTYAHAMKEFRIVECYPILSGYSFWKTLFMDIRSSGSTNNSRATRLRQLMVLTILKSREGSLPETEMEENDQLQRQRLPVSFNNLTTAKICWFIRCRRSSISDAEYLEQIPLLTSNLTEETEPVVDDKITMCFDSGHVLTRYFREMHDVLSRQTPTENNVFRDKKLFFNFVSDFDKHMFLLSSHKVERIFQLLNVEPRKTVQDDDPELVQNGMSN